MFLRFVEARSIWIQLKPICRWKFKFTEQRRRVIKRGAFHFFINSTTSPSNSFDCPSFPILRASPSRGGAGGFNNKTRFITEEKSEKRKQKRNSIFHNFLSLLFLICLTPDSREKKMIPRICFCRSPLQKGVRMKKGKKCCNERAFELLWDCEKKIFAANGEIC